MDPLKALADLDKVVANTPVNRVTHEHLMQCVLTIRTALTPKPEPTE
jgi:hypothetical protein